MLEVKNLTVQYGESVIVHNVSFSVREGWLTVLAGPNGAGKSTIVNAVSQGAAYTGSILYDGQDISKIKPRQLAKKIGVLTQSRQVAYPFSVGEIVKLGRYSYSSGMSGFMAGDDMEHVKAALEMTGMTRQVNQSALTLSGGELQRVFLAQIFAQNPNLLILDEPANHLDIAYQKHIFELIGRWLKKPKRAVLAVVHDLSFAKTYGTHAVLLNEGSVVSFGETKRVMTKENLKQAYGIDVYAWMRDMMSQWEE